MPPYPTYKLGDVAEIILGQSPESKSYNTKGEGLPFFQGKTEFTDWFPIPNKWCTEPKKIAEPFDVLLSVRAPVGPTNIAKEKCCIGRGLAAIRYADCYKYVLYYLRSVSKYLESKATGTTFSSISGDTIKNLSIPLPPLPTQHQIVSRIESLFAELDKAEAHLRAAQQQLKTYRQAVLNHWLNNEDGKWETVNLGEVAEKIQIGPFGTQLHKSDYINGGIPLINPMHICNKKILPDYSFSVSNVKYKELTNYYLKKDDVILGRRGEMGRCAIVSEKEDGMLCGTGSLFIRGGKLLNATYLCHLLSSQKIVSYFENSSSGTTMSNLNQGIIRNCEIPFPPLSDQQRIVQEIESRLSQAEAAEARIAESLQKTEALRQSILKKSFSGELV